MKKTIVRVVIGLVGVGLVGTGGAWYTASSTAISQAEKLITEFNAKALPNNGKATITYDSLSRSSFPSVGVRLVNPVMTTSIPADDQGRAAVDMMWKINGYTDVITNHLKNEYRVVSDGTSELQLKSGTETINATSTPSRAELSVAAKNRAAFDQWNSLNFDDKKAVEDAVKNLASLNFSISAGAMKDSATNNVIYSYDASSLKLANRSTDNLVDFDLDMAFMGMEITDAYTSIIQRAGLVMQVPQIGLDQAQLPFSSTRAGKQDMVLSLQVNMPQERTKPVVNGYVRAPKLLIKNDFYRFESPVHIEFKEENKTRNATVKVNAKLEVAPAAAEESKRFFAMLTSNGEVSALMKQIVGGNTAELDIAALNQKLEAALPTLSTLGPITFDVDINASTPSVDDNAPLAKPDADSAPGEHLVIEALRLNHARWGIDAKGMAARVPGAAPSVDIIVICKLCDTMTKDIYDTAMAAQEVKKLLEPQSPQWPLNETVLTKLNGALADIGRKDAQGDITFGISSPSAGNFHINDKPMGEAMQKLMAVFMTEESPKQQAPTTATPPADAAVGAH